MKNKTNIFIIACSLLIASCGSKPKSVSNEISKIGVEKKTAAKVELNPQWIIEELVGIKDGSLFCKGRLGKHSFYVLDGKNFSLKKSFGVRGNGKDEWGYPYLLLSQEKAINYVLDNGKGKMTVLKDFSISQVKDFPVEDIISLPKVYGKYLCYVDEKPDKIAFCLNELKTNKALDIVEFEDKQHKGNSYLEAFVYDLNSEYVVLAQNLRDCFEVYSLTSDSHLQHICEVKGNGQTDESKYFYYSSVAIDGDRIYLLSQRHVDVGSQSGYSSIEVYDLEGKALRNIRLDFIASQMVLNVKEHTLLLLSALDGSLNIVDL